MNKTLLKDSLKREGKVVRFFEAVVTSVIVFFACSLIFPRFIYDLVLKDLVQEQIDQVLVEEDEITFDGIVKNLQEARELRERWQGKLEEVTK